MPEAMQVHPKSKGFFGASADSGIYGFGTHGSSLIGRPDGGVRISTGDAASEPFQIQIDAWGLLLRGRIVERPPAFGIRVRDVERLKIAGSHEVFADAQRHQRAAAQWYERQERNDQPVSIFEGVSLGYPLGGICVGDRVVHELDPERVEAISLVTR